MREPITTRQMEVYAFIRTYLINNGVSPSYREMMDAFGINSTNGLRTHIDVLRKKGWVEKHRGKARGITLVSDHWKHDVESLKLVEKALGTLVNNEMCSSREMDLCHDVGAAIREELTYDNKNNVRKGAWIGKSKV